MASSHLTGPLMSIPFECHLVTKTSHILVTYIAHYRPVPIRVAPTACAPCARMEYAFLYSLFAA